MINKILTYFLAHQAEILSLLGGAGVLSTLLESLLLKLKRSRWHIDSKKLSYTLLHVFTALSTAAVFVAAHLPHADLPTVYGGLLIAAEAWHRFAVSPFYGRVVIPFLEWLSSRKVSVEKNSNPSVGQTSTVTQPQSLDPSGAVSSDQFLGND